MSRFHHVTLPLRKGLLCVWAAFALALIVLGAAARLVSEEPGGFPPALQSLASAEVQRSEDHEKELAREEIMRIKGIDPRDDSTAKNFLIYVALPAFLLLAVCALARGRA